MTHLFGGGADPGWVAVKAILLFLTAVVAFCLGDRRTLAELSPFDFVAAVAVGAIVGRVPNAEGTSYLAGAITLVAVLVTHRIVTQLRYISSVAHLIEHAPRILMADGKSSNASSAAAASPTVTFTPNYGNTASATWTTCAS